MNEMLYGNNGQNDECLNVNMDQALFTRVKSKTFVHALRKVINSKRAVPDSNFIYMGCVEEKGSAYTLYGYQAKMVSDSRGGDYGNYIAVPCDIKKPAMNFPQVKFATEDGFRQYFNESKISDENRFAVSITPTPLNKNALMLLINNVMEMFTSGKVSTCSFSLSTENDGAFSGKSIYVLALILKYLPYAMRKNIAFISRVDGDVKTPNAINLAAYAQDNASKPRDCINVEGETGALTNGMFKNYVEKVFSMDDAKREAYFEQLYAEIEKPLADKNFTVKGGHYLLDTQIKALWATGSDEAVKNIIDSANEIAVFPAYLKLAGKVLSGNMPKAVAYVENGVRKASKIEDMKKLYSNVTGIFKACGFEEGDINAVTMGFVKRTDEFFSLVTNRDDFVLCADAAKAISVNIIGTTAKTKMRDMLSVGSLEEFFAIYSFLKEKQYVSEEELNKIALSAGEYVIEYMVSGYKESKDKLNALTAQYEAFKASCSADCRVVTELYGMFRDKYSGNANSEAIRRGAQVLEEIRGSIRYSADFSRYADYFEKLATIDVTASTDLRARTERAYAQVVDAFKEYACNYDVSGNEFKEALHKINVSVKILESKGIYEGRYVPLTRFEQGVPDGIGRLMATFEYFVQGLESNTTLHEAIQRYNDSVSTMMPAETKNGIIFKKYAPKLFKLWTRSTKKLAKCTSKDLQSAVKKLEKDKRISNATAVGKLVEQFDSIPEERAKKKRGGVSMVVVIIAAAAVLLIAAVVGILFGTGVINLGTDPTESTAETGFAEPEKIMVSPSVVQNVKAYLNSFGTDTSSSAAIVLGNIISRSEENENAFDLEVTKACGGDASGIIKAVYEPTELSKNFTDFKNVADSPDYNYAFVVWQGSDGVYYVRDVLTLPVLEAYSQKEGFNPGNLTDEGLLTFYNEVVQYIGASVCGWSVDNSAPVSTPAVDEPVVDEPMVDEPW